MTDETKNALMYLKLAYETMQSSEDSDGENLDDLWDKMDLETRDLINEIVKEWDKEG